MRTPRGSREAYTPEPPFRSVHRRAQVTTGLIVLPSRFAPMGAKITGERAATPGGRAPTWQRHVATYKLAEPLFGPGQLFL